MKKQISRAIRGIFAVIAIFALSLFISSCEKNEIVEVENEAQELKDIAAVLESYGTYDEGEDLKFGIGKNVPTFNTLLVALIKIKFIKHRCQKKLTVFAPTDKAFAAIGLNPRNIWSVPNLKQILLYHVIGKPVFSY